MKLDDALLEASEALDRITMDAPAGLAPGRGRRNVARTAIVAVTATAVVGGGVALLTSDAALTTTSADQANSADVALEQRLVTGALAPDLSLQFLGSVSDLQVPVQVTTTDVYGIASSPSLVGGPRLTIEHIVSTGIEPIPVAGEVVEVRRGSAHRLAGEPTIVIELDDSQIWVNGPGLSSSELTEIAGRIEIDEDGAPDLLTEVPGQLTFLDSIETGLFPGMMTTVNTLSDIATYTGDNFRHLTITTVPDTEEAWLARLWVGDFQLQTLGGRDVYMTTDEDGLNFKQVLWRDDGSIIRLYASGLTDVEIDNAIAGIYATSDTQLLAATSSQSTTGTVDLPDLDNPTRLVAYNVPAGYQLVLTADHADLGSPTLSSTQTIYGDQTSGNLVTVTEIHDRARTPIRYQDAETTDLDGVVVTHSVGQRTARANFDHEGELVEFSSSSLTGETLLAAIASWRSENDPETVAGMPALDQQRAQGWITADGAEIQGTATGQTAVYASSNATTLTITTDPTVRNFPLSAFLDDHATVSLGSTTGIYYQQGERWYLEFIFNRTMVTIATDDDLTINQLLAVAASLSPATDEEWNSTNG